MPETASDKRLDARLWVSILAGPLAWFADLEASYASVKTLCTNGHRWPLVGVTAAALAVALVGLALGATALRRGKGPAEPERADERIHFMAVVGTAMSALFALAILATAIPTALLHPCEVP